MLFFDYDFSILETFEVEKPVFGRLTSDFHHTTQKSGEFNSTKNWQKKFSNSWKCSADRVTNSASVQFKG